MKLMFAAILFEMFRVFFWGYPPLIEALAIIVPMIVYMIVDLIREGRLDG